MQPKLIYKTLPIILFCWLMVGCVTNLPKPKMTADEIKTSNTIANQAYADKNYKLALFEYLKLSEAIGQDAVIWFRIGNTYARLENNDKAIDAYEKSVLLDPRLSKAWHNMGVIQLKQSVNTWRQMLVYISKDDPLYEKALNLSKKLLEVADEKPASE
ncbi:MAG: tetratricopeptide (TPR) repeat protein [Cellvibrionaceae bacterium]|jgi:tetratricopeptide (TPR) repeat protein